MTGIVNWQSLVTLVVFALCFIAILVAIKKAKGVDKVTVENPMIGKISVEREKERRSEEHPAEQKDSSAPTVSKHADCPLAKDFIIVISKSIRFGSEISEIKEKYIIRDQMNAAQMRMDQYKNIVLKNYMNIIFRKKGQQVNVMEDFSFLVYSYVTNEATKNALMEMKGYFRENHLAEYTDADYDEYVSEHAQKIISNFKMFTNTMLPSFLDPTRQDIEKEIQNDTNSLLTLVKETFYTAREITLRYEAVISKRETEFDSEILELTGIKNASRI